MKRTHKKFLILFILLPLIGFLGGISCSGEQGNILLLPSIVTIDSPNNRVWVIDTENNGLNLVDSTTDTVITKPDDENAGLLTSDDPQLLPLFPSNAGVASLPAALSRLFVIGVNEAPSQQVTVLDYDTTGGLRTSPISPITVPGQAGDVLVGLVVDTDRGVVFVSNSNSGSIHIYDVNTGVEEPDSPLTVSGRPGRMSVDLVNDLLAVANSENTLVTFFDLSDLTAVPVTLDIGISSRDVSIATNSTGSILFVSGSMTNVAQVYTLNTADLSASTLLFQLLPPAPTDSIPDPLFLTGNLIFVAAGNLTNGLMGSYFTQSSGDLLALDLTGDFSSVTPAIVSVGAVQAEGVDVLLNTSSQVTKVYFASPGIGGLTIVDPLTNNFIDQIE